MTAAHDPYTPPAAAIVEPAPDDAREAPFYVVSTTKLVVLYFGTLGLYQLFWFYMHWRRWRSGRSETVWPVARAIFALFYVHALDRRIGATLDAHARARHRWTFAAATVYVMATALDYGSAIAWEWMSWPPDDAWLRVGEWLGILLMPIVCASLVVLQRAANAACGDPQATSNRRFTLFNAAWVALGVSTTTWVMYMLTQGFVAS